jgi:chemotaxis protein MotB
MANVVSLRNHDKEADMYGKNSAVISLAFLIVLGLSGCVSKATFEGMAEQARKLDSDLSDLQNRHEKLLQEKATLLEDKARLEKERNTLTAEKESLTAGNKELEEILAAKEDALSRKITELRLEMARQDADCAGRLAASNKKLEGRAQELTAQAKQIRERDQQLAEQAGQIASTTTANARMSEELRQIRAEKETEVRQMNATYQSLIDKMKNEIDKGQITISELKGKLTVNMIDAILFDSGKAEVKPEGLLVLQRVIDILKEVAGKTIRIEGHTDNVPIIGLLAQKYPSNWELSAARAVNVARFLQERGIDPLNLNAVAYGEYKPVADNASEAGRAKNRRIEIILADKE